jgi:hypothetical protein
MRQVFIARHPGEAYVVRTLLESEGIAAILQGYPPGFCGGNVPGSLGC